jgi:hypothetical protein
MRCIVYQLPRAVFKYDLEELEICQVVHSGYLCIYR